MAAEGLRHGVNQGMEKTCIVVGVAIRAGEDHPIGAAGCQEAAAELGRALNRRRPVRAGARRSAVNPPFIHVPWQRLPIKASRSGLKREKNGGAVKVEGEKKAAPGSRRARRLGRAVPGPPGPGRRGTEGRPRRRGRFRAAKSKMSEALRVSSKVRRPAGGARYFPLLPHPASPSPGQRPRGCWRPRRICPGQIHRGEKSISEHAPAPTGAPPWCRCRAHFQEGGGAGCLRGAGPGRGRKTWRFMARSSTLFWRPGSGYRRNSLEVSRNHNYPGEGQDPNPPIPPS